MLCFSRGAQRCQAAAQGHHSGGHGRGPKMFDAGAMRYVVLQLIADKPRHGYDIIKEIEQRAGGGYTPSPGAIYPLLSMLLDLGHVSSVPDGNKKLHAITDEGQVFLQQNRQYVDAIMARLAAPVDNSTADFRQLMFELKEVVVDRVRNAAPTAGRLDAVRAILRQAKSDIAALE